MVVGDVTIEIIREIERLRNRRREEVVERCVALAAAEG